MKPIVRAKPQSGVAAALEVIAAVRRGAFASQTLRTFELSPTDRTLAASLVYAFLRRRNLWEHVAFAYLVPRPGKFSPFVRDALTLGAAGVLELRHFAPAVLVNALVDWTKPRDRGGAGVVNAVLRRILSEGPDRLASLGRDDSLAALCLRVGLPEWVVQRWVDCYGEAEARRLAVMDASPPALSLRLSPGVGAREEAVRLTAAGFGATPSDLLPESLRLQASALPTALPGFAEGRLTPQSESSMIVGREAATLCPGGRLLDVCAGRAVKAGGILQADRALTLEGWDLSASRIAAGRRELERLGLADRAELRSGDGCTLEPLNQPDGVVVDAPCSASGTWRRHPEAKWRLTTETLAELVDLQRRLLLRACELVPPGGSVLYATCSRMAEENEKVVEAVTARCSMEVVPLAGAWSNGRPRSVGLALEAATPWSDGFYLVRLRRRAGGGENEKER